MLKPAILALLTFVIGINTQCGKNLIPDLSYRLTGTNLAFPCDATRNIYLQTGRYVPKNVIGTRIQIYKDDAIVALPRFKHGVPFTLAKFSLKTRGCQATLQPYPCWSIQEEGNPEALQNVVDLFLDALDILWVLDLGITNTLEQPVKRGYPKIVGINVCSGQVVKIIDLSPFATPCSRFQYLVADYDKNGRVFIYATDAGSGAIIVYDVFACKGYRVVLPRAACSCGHKDVLYLVLVRKDCGNNVVYFTYLSDSRLFSIKAIYLQNGQASGAIVDVGPKPQGTKIVLLGTDNGAAIFFRYKGESDIYIWNSDTAFKSENFLLVQKGGDCRLSTQVVPGYKRLMWAIESNFQDYINNAVGCLGASVVVHPLIKTCD